MSFYCTQCRMSVEDVTAHQGKHHGMETTLAQRMAVRRDKCREHGHSFSERVANHSLAPSHVHCSNCGSHWRIHPDDAGEDFARS